MTKDSEYPLLNALVLNRRSAAAVDALWLAAQLWLANGGAIPINRYLKLPATRQQLMNASRNLWIVRAAALVPEIGAFQKAGRIALELSNFVSRGQWSTWKSLDSPPSDASELRVALFGVMKFSSKNDPIEERQIYRVLTHTMS